jgi:hypothetical protein
MIKVIKSHVEVNARALSLVLSAVQTRWNELFSIDSTNLAQQKSFEFVLNWIWESHTQIWSISAFAQQIVFHC